MSFSRFSLSSLATMLCLVVVAPSQAHGLAGDLASANPPAMKKKGSQPAGAAQQVEGAGAGDASSSSQKPGKRRRRGKTQPPPPSAPPPANSYVPYHARAGRTSIYYGDRPHDFGFEIAVGSAVSKVQESAARFDSLAIHTLTDHSLVWGVQATRQGAPVQHAVGSGDARVDLESTVAYGGLVYGRISSWESLVNWRTQLLLGGGTLEVAAVDRDASGEGDASGASETFGVYVAEPLFGFYFNLTSVLRFGFDLSYRFVVVDEAGVRGESYSGVSGGVSLRGGDL